MAEAREQALPAGIVTFLFTDIEGSTRLLGELGEAYAPMLELHHHLLRDVWQEFGGYEIDAVGDSFLVAFSEADAALEAAIVAQQTIAGTRWPMDKPLRVRMGIHSGYARPRQGKYVAMALHQAARVINAAHGGQILVSEPSRDTLSSSLRPTLEELGHFRVRDFQDPPLLFRVVAEGWQDHRKPPRARPAEKHNLVPATSPLVAREDMLNELADAVRVGTLSSLLGPGGVGKSRLAAEFGMKMADAWPDGVWMVTLESTRSMDQTYEILAEAIAAPRSDSAPILDDILQHLRDLEALIILDNCEHIVSEVAQLITAVRRRCPHLGLLATTQVPLGLVGEKIIRLPPLATRSGSPASDSPALQLFLQRASNVPTDEREAAAALCERLDGMPLAIELAAARTSSMPPSVILSQLDHTMDVLRIRDPGLPARHRSISAVLSWSMGLLSADELRVLCCIAVFVSDFSMKSAQAIAHDEFLSEAVVATTLWTLVDRSLVWLDESSGGSRFRLPTSTRIEAWESLAQSVQNEILKGAGAYFLKCFPPHETSIASVRLGMSTELANLRAVVDRLVGLDEDIGQALAWSLTNHYRKTGIADGVPVTLDYVRKFRLESPSRVGFLSSLIKHFDDAGRADEAQYLLSQALEVQAQAGAPDNYPTALTQAQAFASLRRGNLGECADLLESACDLAVSAMEKCDVENIRGLTLATLGDFEQANDAFGRAVEFAQVAECQSVVAKNLGNMAECTTRLGRPAEAARWQRQALEIARAQDSLPDLAVSLLLAARLLQKRRELEVAVAFSSAGIQLYEELELKLYPDDQELINLVNSEAQNVLGVSAFAQAVELGKSWSRTTAADRVSAALDELAQGID